MTNAERLNEALLLLREALGTKREEAARAYLSAQLEIAKRSK